MGRQRRLLATRGRRSSRSTAAFAGSTAVFNSTYQQQAEVDARLTNGADVTVTESPGAAVGPQGAAQLADGARRRQRRAAAAPLRLRRRRPPGPLRRAPADDRRAPASSRTPGSRAAPRQQLMAELPQRPDGVLVSAETVKDFQLRPATCSGCGSRTAATKQFKTVPFHYVGRGQGVPDRADATRSSSPTASYVARATGSDAVGALPRPDRRDEPRRPSPSGCAARSGTTAQVTDIVNQRKVVGSNLTAVELSGLTKVELGFALVLAVAASGLALGLGFAERRRTFAIAGRARRASAGSSAASCGASRCS